MFDSIYLQIGITAVVLVVGFVFIKGDEPERLAGGAYVLISLAGLFIPEGTATTGPLWGRMGLDFVQLVVFLGLAWHSRRTWLFWASAFQSLIVTAHVLVLSEIRPPSDAFAAMNNMANYGLLVAMAVGTFWAWQERRAAGLER